MNFIAALQHATIGYGIRRRVWPADVLLRLGSDPGECAHTLYWDTNGEPCELLGSDQTMSATAEDVRAHDWESI